MILTPRFLIISAVIHKNSNGQIGGYTPYVREMNLWFKYVGKVKVIAPIFIKTSTRLNRIMNILNWSLYLCGH
jgi:uncharacterized protein (UPF0254 family)